MKRRITIVDALKHPALFGSLSALQSMGTWGAWIVWLKAVFCIPMTSEELLIYQQCTGRQTPPTKQPSEVFTIVGRRGGKSFISAIVACYLACFESYTKYLNAGERGVILVLAVDKEQARIIFLYITGIIRAITALNQMIVAERVNDIELSTGVIIMVRASDFRSVRGLSVVSAICDEAAFWNIEGASPVSEVLIALRPSMVTIPNSKLLVISTPYSQSGSLYEAHRDHFGKDDEHVLIWQAPTTVMNPLISEALVQRELERDPDAGQAEWLAAFRSDLSAAFSPEALEACTVKGRDELPASPLIQYQAFVDPSGGKVDSFTVSIAHKENAKAVIDLVKAWFPPFDPGVVTGEMAEVLKGYGVLNVTGDNYGGEWPVASFRSHGIAYERCEKSKSELYLAFVPVTNSGGVELPDDKRLFNELRRLERRRGRTGKDTIDHQARGHDDLANSVAGVAFLILHAENRLRFDQQKLRELLQATCEPNFRGMLHDSPDNILHIRLEENSAGPVLLWEQPQMGRSYVIGAHGGIESSSAYVLERGSLDVCAEFHGSRIDQDRFAEEIIRLGKTYGNALIGTEDDDNPTHQALLRLRYTRLYKHDLPFVKASWIAAAVDDLSAVIREGFNCPARELIDEMLNVVVKDDGKTELRGKSRTTAIAVAVRVNATSGLQSIYPSLLRKRQEQPPAGAETSRG